MKKVRDKHIDSLSELCDALSRAPLRFKPGSQVQYSFSTDFIGRICEVVSGMPLEQFVRKRVLAPLGMTSTFFKVPAQKLKGYATLYNRQAASGKAPRRLTPLHCPYAARMSEPLSPGQWIHLQSVPSGLNVTASADDFSVSLEAPSGRDRRPQLFCVERRDVDGAEGAVRLRSAATGRCLGTSRTSDGGTTIQCHGSAAWLLQPLSSAKAAAARKVRYDQAVNVVPDSPAKGLVLREKGRKMLGMVRNHRRRELSLLSRGDGNACSFKVLRAAPPSCPDAAPDIASGGGGVLSYTDAGIASCARDYARFLMMIVNGGELDGRRVLKEDTVRSLWEDQMERYSSTGWVKGWHDDYDNAKTGWSILNSHVEMNKDCGSSAKRRAKVMWMAGSGGPGWTIDVDRELVVVSFASVLGGAFADAEAAARRAVDRAPAKHKQLSKKRARTESGASKSTAKQRRSA
eukprot:TRINITY_DN26108_c0_g1_i3.p1 TRINITY_DN26108_c0_g1~~TRINITY_DN26108_c0_g1_i3.p1  ORF type:complete len:460 (-),score=64.55 TRINITY_DN26108_c0_g1_i3:280-1659(-)